MNYSVDYIPSESVEGLITLFFVQQLIVEGNLFATIVLHVMYVQQVKCAEHGCYKLQLQLFSPQIMLVVNLQLVGTL